MFRFAQHDKRSIRRAVPPRLSRQCGAATRSLLASNPLSRSWRWSLRLCRGSGTWLLSPGFDHRRPNRAHCLWFCSSWTFPTRHARLSGARFLFDQLRGCRNCRQFRGTGLRIRSARSSRLWRTSVFQPLGSKRSCHSHLLGRQRCRTGFLFARLRFGYSRGWRFGWRLLRGRRCLFGSLWFLFVSNDHLLRMDLPDKNKAAD